MFKFTNKLYADFLKKYKFFLKFLQMIQNQEEYFCRQSFQI